MRPRSPPTPCSSRSIRSCGACGMPDNRELLVSDTVGFIDRLPHALIAAFSATLEEVAEADLILHVIDAGSADRERQMAAVRQRARRGRRGGCSDGGGVNKIDTITADERRRLREADPSAALISATAGTGAGELLQMMASRLGARHEARDHHVR